MRVIDSSSLIKFFSREEGWEKVAEVMREGVVTLDLAVKEVANALWRKILSNEVGYDTAQAIIRDLAEEKAIPLISQDKLLTQALTLAVNEKITVYDALFVIAAKELKTELVTSDKKQVEAAVRNGVKAILI
ncbi:MAG: type II toxin-antitoxin system VapC family toxin [Desulfurococcus sp.]|uniref:type II toxin-antitoxin system VapC family toxin n=1 Tax=Desulfurococcus sp. TaxID=51678 RepID=UPI0031627E76